mmetsp:Transcript_30186/g.76353  ORF Transcript_30186/g.76353 Transcript_30186/m.76353 type:complete len:99 (+) Transcript_30186:2-298(+)
MAPSDGAAQASYNYYSEGMSALDNSWHGFIKAEHDLWGRLAINDAADWGKTGKTTYKGLSQLECPEELPSITSLEPGARTSLVALFGSLEELTAPGRA